jgi:hypothetical protein
MGAFGAHVSSPLWSLMEFALMEINSITSVTVTCGRTKGGYLRSPRPALHFSDNSFSCLRRHCPMRSSPEHNLSISALQAARTASRPWLPLHPGRLAKMTSAKENRLARLIGSFTPVIQTHELTSKFAARSLKVRHFDRGADVRKTPAKVVDSVLPTLT